MSSILVDKHSGKSGRKIVLEVFQGTIKVSKKQMKSKRDKQKQSWSRQTNCSSIPLATRYLFYKLQAHQLMRKQMVHVNVTCIYIPS